ncbi:hypothetical protein YC2023_038916 [Brassica napus]
MYSFRKKVITCSVEWFAVHFDSSLNQCPSAQYFQKHFEARQATQTKFHEFPENNGTLQVPGLRSSNVVG